MTNRDVILVAWAVDKLRKLKGLAEGAKNRNLAPVVLLRDVLARFD
jgi:hypothetical protein